jgi:hypothetical protein
VVAKLYAKNRSNGNVTLVASVSSLPATTVKVVTVPLAAPLSFKRYAYYVVLTLDGLDLPVEAHMAMLTTN